MLRHAAVGRHPQSQDRNRGARVISRGDKEAGLIAGVISLSLAVVSAGIYMVEDTLTSYWPDFAGGYRKPGTFLEYRCAPWSSVQSQVMDAECRHPAG